jgi:hypothetical protein
MASIFDGEKNCCRDSIGGSEFYRILGYYKTNGTPNDAVYINKIENYPLSHVEAKRSSNQSIPISTFTNFDYNSIFIDLNSEVTTGTGWNFNPKTVGRFAYSAVLRFSNTSWAAGDLSIIRQAVNALSKKDAYFFEHPATFTKQHQYSGNDIVNLNPGHTLELKVFQDAASPLNTEANALYNVFTLTQLKD